MTRKRYDQHSTEFGLWLRQQKRIDSHRGFVATDVDYIWHNYKTGEWMILEEKRYNGKVSFAQEKTLTVLDSICQNDPLYKGLHIIIFSKTSPKDGPFTIDGTDSSKEDLLNFLQFKKIDYTKKPILRVSLGDFV